MKESIDKDLSDHTPMMQQYQILKLNVLIIKLNVKMTYQ
ncbi:Uncharacterised protein [Raoultella terrigena]|nr:Uncharacterised protein [Raoultella terrigena]